MQFLGHSLGMRNGFNTHDFPVLHGHMHTVLCCTVYDAWWCEKIHSVSSHSRKNLHMLSLVYIHWITFQTCCLYHFVSKTSCDMSTKWTFSLKFVLSVWNLKSHSHVDKQERHKIPLLDSFIDVFLYVRYRTEVENVSATVTGAHSLCIFRSVAFIRCKGVGH